MTIATVDDARVVLAARVEDTSTDSGLASRTLFHHLMLLKLADANSAERFQRFFVELVDRSDALLEEALEVGRAHSI